MTNMIEAEKKFVALDAARVAYREKGEGKPVLFVHGIPTFSFLWRGVMNTVGRRFRCLAPDLMGLGDTEVSLDRDYSMPAQADMVFRFMKKLELPPSAVVAHDQGGACAQILATRHPEMTTHLVLVNSVAYDNWPVPEVKRTMRIFRILPLVWAVDVAFSLGPKMVGRRMFRKTVADRTVFTDTVIAEYVRAIGSSRARRRRFRKFALAGDCAYTMRVAKDLEKYDRPTMVVWGTEDRFLPLRWGERLFAGIKGARRLERIPSTGHFVPEEKPEVLANLILDFLGAAGREN